MKYCTILIFIFFILAGCKSTEDETKTIPFVKMSFDISKEGKPINIKVLDAQPNSYNNQKAITALSKWEYKPLIVDGVAVVKTNLKVQLEF
jgi:TonB family protein